MSVQINKFIDNISLEEIFNNCLITLTEPHKAGDIIDGKVLIPDIVLYGDVIPTWEQIDQIIYDSGFVIKAINIDFIDDITINTDMTLYGFTKVGKNRYCKSDEAIFWAKLELSCRREEN